MNFMREAEEILTAPAGDVVMLAQGADPRGLDLRALAEYETRPGGGVRVKLTDRAALAAAMIRSGWTGESDTGKVERLYRALEGSCARTAEEFEEGI